MSTSEILTLTGLDQTALSASTEAQQRRDDLLKQARAIKKVTTADDAAEAGAALTALKGFTRQIDVSRQGAKAPVLDLGKRIDALAKELVTEADEEANRISKLVGAFNAEQARIAERKRQEALAEERRIQEETRAKLEQAEAAGASEKKLERIEDRAFEQLAVAKANTAAAVAPKVAGLATRKEVCFEVLDIEELYRAYPMMVTLTPNNAAIKAALKNSPKGLPGVRHWTEDRAIVR